MRLLRSTVLGWLGLASTCLLGCSSDAFVPPPPPELSQVPVTSSGAPSGGGLTTRTGASTLQVIFAGPSTVDRQTYERTARQEAGRRKMIVTMAFPEGSDLAASQASLIRKASREQKASAIVVEALDDPRCVAALREAREAGTVVVVFGGKVTLSSNDASIYVVHFEPVEPLAKELVDILLSDAKTNAASKDAHAAVLRNTSNGPDADALAAMVAKLLKDRGVPKVETVPFGEESPSATKALNKTLEADSKLELVVALDEYGVNGAIQSANDFKEKRGVFVAGFMIVDRNLPTSALSEAAAIVDRNLHTMIQRAIQTASKRVDGEVAEPVVVIPNPLHRRTFTGRSAFHQATPTEGPKPGEIRPIQ